MNKKGFITISLAGVSLAVIIAIVVGILLLVFGTAWLTIISLNKIAGFALLYFAGKSIEKTGKLEGKVLALMILSLILLFNPGGIVDKILPAATIPLN